MAERQPELSRTINRRVGGALPAMDTLAVIMGEFLGLALRYHPGGVEPDEKKFVKYSNMAASYARDLLPYQSARLAPTTPPELPPDNRSLDELRAEIVADAVRLGILPLEASEPSGVENSSGIGPDLRQHRQRRRAEG